MVRYLWPKTRPPQTSRRVVCRTHVSIGRVSDIFFRPTKTIIFWLFHVKASEFFLEMLGAPFYLISVKTTAAATFFLRYFFSSLFVLHKCLIPFVCVACRYVWTCMEVQESLQQPSMTYVWKCKRRKWKRTCCSVAWRIYESAGELAAA